MLPFNSRKAKGYPNTTIHATLSKPEVALTGLRRIRVHVSVKGSAVKKVKGEPDEAARMRFDQRVGETCDALMQSDDGETLRATAEAITAAGRALAVPADDSAFAAAFAAANADMAEFTCQGWYDAEEGDGAADEEGCAWEEVLVFEALCSGSDVD